MVKRIASRTKYEERAVFEESAIFERAASKLYADTDYFEEECNREMCECLYNVSADKHSLQNTSISHAEADAQLKAYCAHHPKNLPCKTRCRRRTTCGNIDSPYKSISDKARHCIRTWINTMRSVIATGSFRDIFHTAANMRVINYDLECEFFAGCYLKGCFNQDVYPKIALDGTHLGATGYGYISFNMTVNRISISEMVTAFMLWTFNGYGSTLEYPYINPNYYDFLVRDKMPQFSNDFLQMYAANTSHIGCALYNRNLSSHLIFYQFYCVYRQAVSFAKNFTLYKVGPPASACDEWGENESTIHSGLCGKVRLLSEDPFRPFVDLNSSSSVTFTLELFLGLCFVFLVA